MYTVKSKYKNPDKFLAKLRVQLDSFAELHRDWSFTFNRLRGNYWFTWENGATHSVLFKCGDDSAKKAFLGQKVKIEGRIVKYCREDDGEETVHISLGRVSLLSDE